MSLTYSLSTDFGGSINNGKLISEVTDNSTITTTLTGVRVDEDDVTLIFQSTLTSAEQTELETVVIPAHDSSASPFHRRQQSVTVNYSAQTNDYTCIMRFVLICGNTSHQCICLNAWTDNASNPVDVRLYDATNSNIISTTTGITSTSTTNIIEMEGISNFPTTGKAIIELQGKGTGTCNVGGFTILW